MAPRPELGPSMPIGWRGAGHDLILMARRVDLLHAVAERLTDDTGRLIETVDADLTVVSDLARVETRVSRRTPASEC